VLGDEYALQQVITHLVRNAIQFTVAGGRITVRTFRREGKAVAEIEDTGVGIPEQDLPLIFDPFYRADKARQFRMGEMGLGLTIAKRLVELHEARRGRKPAEQRQRIPSAAGDGDCARRPAHPGSQNGQCKFRFESKE
jgi:signal transduction histidine kinase